MCTPLSELLSNLTKNVIRKHVDILPVTNPGIMAVGMNTMN